MSDKDIVINDIDAGNTPCKVCFPRLVCQKETGKLNLIDQLGSCKVNIIEYISENLLCVMCIAGYLFTLQQSCTKLSEAML